MTLFSRAGATRLFRLLASAVFVSAAALSAAGPIVQWGGSAAGQQNGRPADSQYVQVALGSYHCVALKADGSIAQWGNSDFNQLNGKPSDSGYIQVAAGGYHSLALKSDGTIVQWGANWDGQLNGKPTGAGYVQVTGGLYHSLALKADGSIVQWGNSYGNQLIGKPTDSGYVQLAAGATHNIALKADGTIVQWGNSAYNQLSNKPTGSGYVQVAAGGAHNIALKADGSIVQWGDTSYSVFDGKPSDNGYVQVATGNLQSAALRADGSIVQWGNPAAILWNGKPTQPGYVAVASGGEMCAAIRISPRSWTVTRLHPIGALESSANAVDGAKQGGYADYGSGSRATTWADTNAVNDLGPGVVNGLDGGREYGDIGSFAYCWNGSEASVLPLTSIYDLTDSHCSDAADGQQVGWGFDGFSELICVLWTGPNVPGSMLNFGSFTTVNGVGNGVQVGQTILPTAVMWTGTFLSATDLNPIGATASGAYGTDGVQEVGSATFGGVEMAGLWKGTPSSWTSMHPVGASRSVALRVDHGMQVGYAVISGVRHASYWEGSSGSWIDLGASLPAEFAGMESTAKDISVQGNTVRIVGDAINGLTGQREAVMWVNVAGAVDTAIDNNFDQFGKTLAIGETTLSRTLFFTTSGSAAAGVEDFQYSVDGAPFKRCGKAVYLTSMAPGTHTIEVRAVDSNANVDLTPASLNWTVTTPALAADGIESYINSLALPTSASVPLLTFLHQAMAMLNDVPTNNDAQALIFLKNFTMQVSNLLNQGKLTPQQAQYLSDQATKLIAALS